MPCHLEYFDRQGYFDALGYAKNMGVKVEVTPSGTENNLDIKKILDQDLSLDEALRLKEAIGKASQDSKDGNLTGIVGLIQLVEDLQEKYGHEGEHTHTTEAIVQAMCDNPTLIKHYGLEKLAKKLQQSKNPYTIPVNKNKKPDQNGK